MAKKNTKKSSEKRIENPLFQVIPRWTPRMKTSGSLPKKQLGMVFVFGQENAKKTQAIVSRFAPAWQKSQLKKNTREVIQFVGNQGPVWIFSPKEKKGPFSHSGRLEESPYAWMRDQAGSLLAFFKAYGVENIAIEFDGTSDTQERGFLVGFELAAYSFKGTSDGTSHDSLPQILLKKTKGKISSEVIEQAGSEGAAVNLARHLVNTPPNFLNPETMAQLATNHFRSSKTMSVDIWNEDRLKREGMGLILGVGQGAAHAPRMVHLRYRPKTKSNHKPIALVGKGITFDSGGLDIKPSAGMRLMKKDMGGSAAVLGLAQWAEDTQYPRPLDFYLALAENAVDAQSMRPSDVLTARNGMKIEIHNTDAEGRLVLADVIDVAVTQKGDDEPETVINLATLTGAIKVALGADLAGLFSNYDVLAERLNRCGQTAGDLNWRMPLFGKMNSGMSTPFADMVNAVDGFGGAITAALFLEKFVRQKPWAHLDIYAWNDKASGALSFSGGSGQPVQALVEFLKSEI